MEPAPSNQTERPEARKFVAQIVITAAVALALGVTLKMPTQFGANDVSRWCTVWSLLERGTYAIDDCPWQSLTQDKVLRDAPFQKPGAAAPAQHYYSSKPPLLSTLIAGVLYPFRVATGVPLDRLVLQPREPRNVEKEIPGQPGKVERLVETPKEPAKWPAYVFYLKPIVVLLNIVPFWIVMILYARLLDDYAANDWAWFLSLCAGAFGVLLFAFESTLNNHTVAASSAFFAIYAFLRVWDDERQSPVLFAVSGFFAAFCACNELPAALFGLVLFGTLLARFPRPTLLYFATAAAIPCLAFLATQYLAFGQFRPVYEEFGTKSYNFAGSYWNTPLELDWLNKNPEPWGVYLFHMTFGHHGVFSLSPIFIFSIIGAVRVVMMARKGRALAWQTLFLTAAMLAFYTWNPKARNYGGSTQGLRWLFWLTPFWLALLPQGVEDGQDRRWVRWLSLGALAASVFSVGYAIRIPWSHPWLLDAMEHLNVFTLKR
jgi:hypothetical protein